MILNDGRQVNTSKIGREDLISLLECILLNADKPAHRPEVCETNNCRACEFEAYEDEIFEKGKR